MRPKRTTEDIFLSLFMATGNILGLIYPQCGVLQSWGGFQRGSNVVWQICGLQMTVLTLSCGCIENCLNAYAVTSYCWCKTLGLKSWNDLSCRMWYIYCIRSFRAKRFVSCRSHLMEYSIEGVQRWSRELSRQAIQVMQQPPQISQRQVSHSEKMSAEAYCCSSYLTNTFFHVVQNLHRHRIHQKSKTIYKTHMLCWSSLSMYWHSGVLLFPSNITCISYSR